MNGEILPLVMLPRYTSFVGATSFKTAPLESSAFANATLTLWRGKLVGTGTPTFTAFFETSNDTVTWSSLVPAGVDPGEDTALVVATPLKQAWFRLKIVLTGTNVGVGCWCAGHVELRVS
jgi:hypothetical protein